MSVLSIVRGLVVLGSLGKSTIQGIRELSFFFKRNHNSF